LTTVAGSIPVRMQASACGRVLSYHVFRVLAPDGISVAVQDWTPANASGAPPDTSGRPAVIFIHGFSQSHGAWLKQVTSSLAEDHRLVTYDLRGHGESAKPTDPMFYRESSRWAGELREVMACANLVKPVVVAWSYAGRVVLDYLSAYGDSGIAGLVMVNATSKADADVLGPAIPLLRQMGNSDPTISADATRALLHACVAKPLPVEEFEYMYRYNMAVPSKIRANLGGRETAYEPALKRLRVPTLVLHGDLDPINLPAMAAYTVSQVRGARRIQYEDVAHMPFWESPQRFNRDLAEFVSSIC
jgi:pimeloyl-ACP methyl ester carboxylesterase